MNKGFTVIELLGVLAIIVMIMSTIIFNVGLERQNSALLRSAQKLSLDLRRVQNYALSSKTYKTNEIPCGWGIHFNGAGSTNYIIFADSAVNANCFDRDFLRAADGSEDFENINLDSGITINNLSNSLSDVVFTPPEPIVNFIPNQTAPTITLSNKNGAMRSINLNKTGFISLP